MQARDTTHRKLGHALEKGALRVPKPSRHDFPDMPRHPIRLVLDGVQQNYNIGAIFRLADAMLVEQLVICGTEVNLRNRKVVQAARGTQHWVPWRQEESGQVAVAAARQDGYQVVVVEQTSASVPVDQLVVRLPVCLVMGAEMHGVSQAVIDMADAAIEIPMFGMSNSINVASAAAIVLHHLVKQIAGGR